MQMDGMVIHLTQVADANPDFIACFTHQRLGGRKTFTVDREHVEIAHFQGVRPRGSSLNGPFAEHEDKVPIDVVFRLGMARVHDKHADEPHAFLGHGVVVGVVHIGAVLPEGPFVFKRLTWFDAGVAEPTDAIHAHG